MEFQLNLINFRKLSNYSLRLTLILGFLSAQIGCATYSKQQVDQTLEQFKGLSLQQLIAAWGVPNKQVEVNGQYFVEWIAEEDSGSSSISLGTGGGGRHSFFGLGLTLPIEHENDICVRQAKLDEKQQIVIQLKWRGDADFCGELLYSQKNKD